MYREVCRPVVYLRFKAYHLQLSYVLLPPDCLVFRPHVWHEVTWVHEDVDNCIDDAQKDRVATWKKTTVTISVLIMEKAHLSETLGATNQSTRKFNWKDITRLVIGVKILNLTNITKAVCFVKSQDTLCFVCCKELRFVELKKIFDHFVCFLEYIDIAEAFFTLHHATALLYPPTMAVAALGCRCTGGWGCQFWGGGGLLRWVPFRSERAGRAVRPQIQGNIRGSKNADEQLETTQRLSG